MAKNIWMRMFWDDYFNATFTLSTIEHGIYLLLIGYYWKSEGKLTSDKSKLLKALRLDVSEIEQLNTVLDEFFTIEDGFLKHTRIDKELQEAQEFRDAQSLKGKKSGDKRREKATTVEPRLNQCLNSVDSLVVTENEPYSQFTIHNTHITTQLQSPINNIGESEQKLYISQDFNLQNCKSKASLLTYINKMEIDQKDKEQLRIQVMSAFKDTKVIGDIKQMSEIHELIESYKTKKEETYEANRRSTLEGLDRIKGLSLKNQFGLLS